MKMAETSAGAVNPLDWARETLPADEFEKLRNSMDEALDISIRINTLKWSAKDAARKLAERYGWTLEPIPFCPSGYRVRSSAGPPSATIEHRLGYFYIQEAASMLPAELFDLDAMEAPLILDMAASPGGKTTHLSALSGDRGLIVANDGSRARIPALQIVLRNWGAASQCVTCLPGESFGDLYPNTFDAVLLDAPCSMQGLRAAESHNARPITLTEIDALADRQTRMLESALRAANPGGQVVYSTCTLAPQEDELVLARILDQFEDFVRVEDVESRLPAPAPGMRKFNGKPLPEQVSRAVRLWPHTFGTAGFFAARLTKLDELPAAKSGAWRRPPQKLIYTHLTRGNLKGITAQLKDDYGVDIGILVENRHLEAVEHKKRIFLIPVERKGRLDDLACLSSGMELGRQVHADFIPSHEFVSRFGDQFTRGVLILEENYLAAWSRGEDLRGYKKEEFKPGQILAIRDEAGRNLGRGKLLADRLKNMLPTRLF